MAKLYAVTSGAYSDYGIDALFSSKEKAVEYYLKLKKENKGPYGEPTWLEEYEDGVVGSMRDLEMFFVVFDSYGNVENVVNDEPRTEDVFLFQEGRASVYVYAVDKGSAVKIAAEKRAVAMSLEEGI